VWSRGDGRRWVKMCCRMVEGRRHIGDDDDGGDDDGGDDDDDVDDDVVV